ncbi:MAG: PGPGW domain-containing protein [Verrucomicrobiota bacterium]
MAQSAHDPSRRPRAFRRRRRAHQAAVADEVAAGPTPGSTSGPSLIWTAGSDHETPSAHRGRPGRRKCPAGRHRDDRPARPAIIVIPAGLAILALEFAWARLWLRKVRKLLPISGKKEKKRDPGPGPDASGAETTKPPPPSPPEPR